MSNAVDLQSSSVSLSSANITAYGARHTPISIAVDPVALVVTECITVTSAMRKHARWAHSSVAAILGGNNAVARPPPSPRIERAGNSVSDTPLLEEDDAINNRWGLRGQKGKSMQDNPLMAAFSRLRSDLKKFKNIQTYDTPALLHPFLQVIRSSSTNAPITSLALIAVTKFLSYNIITRESPRLAEAMQLLSSAITHCRYEASQSDADDIPLLRILRLMEAMMFGPGGDILGDESVCEMMERGLSICCQPRLSEVLRRQSEITMGSMCQVVFERLKHLEIEAGMDPDVLAEETQDDMDKVKMDPSTGGNLQVDTPKLDDARTSNSLDVPHEPSLDGTTPNGSQLDLTVTNRENAEETPVEIRPYSLPSIRELFRVLVDLLDPHEKQNNDTMRIMALRIIDVALVVAGPSIATHPSLASLAKDNLCRHLFQLVRSDNMPLLNESLRVCGTLLATCRSVLKLQQELYLSYVVACLFPRVEIPSEPGIHPSLYEGVPQAPSVVKQAVPKVSEPASGRSTPVPVKDRQRLGLEGGSRKPDAREAMVENVGALVRMPSFMAELFVNYDCEIDRTDLCTDMVGLLARNAFPDSATWSTTNVPPLCLDSLLSYVQFIADRLEDEPETEGLPDPIRLREQRTRKAVIIRGATKFNEKPKAGIAFLVSQGIISSPDDARSVAHFLRGTSRIDKKILGEFISKKDHGNILDEFLDAFDFRGQRADEALRQILNTFRLPGESQLIERIVTNFAEKYFNKEKPEGIANADAIYVLTYAIIMLNTDQHNPNMKQKRMAIEDFAKNLRGVNNGKDFPPEYLQGIYNSIKSQEIILPEEHDNKHAYDHAWKELLVKIQSAKDQVICDTNVYDADMFAATWKPVVATLSYVFMSATDDVVFSRVVTGFDQCAQIASKHGLHDCLDRIVASLSLVSSLAPDFPPSTSLNTEVTHEQKKIMVSETAVRFGRDDRAQLATVILFRVLKGNEQTLREGWSNIIRILLNLFVNSLIPASYSPAHKALDLPPIPLQSSAQVIDKAERAAETGLFSSFASYVSSFANDEPPEPSEQEIEYTLTTIDTINACSLPEIITNILQLPIPALRSLLITLLSQIPEDSSPRVIVVKPELPQQAAKPHGKRRDSIRTAYDPTLTFILELSTILATRDADTIETLGKDVADALQTIIRDAANVHYVVVTRAVYYLLKLLRTSEDYDFLRAPVVLHTISSFDQELLKQSAVPLLKGMADCINGPSGLRSEMASSPDFWSILNTLGPLPHAAPLVFKVVEDLATSNAINADNYEATVAILNEFATAGSVGAKTQVRLSGRKGPPQKTEQSKKPENNEVVARGSKAMSLIHQITERVPQLITQSQLEPTKAWNAYWSPVLGAMTTQCLNPCREIRAQAFASLQRTLLSSNLTSPDHKEWTAIFGEVLFPLITQLLKPEVYQSDPAGMSETRVRGATLVCKIYLHYLVELTEWDGMLDLWIKILGVMDRLMSSGQGDNLEEAVSENLKNILLVMSSGGYLSPPDETSSQDPAKAELWNETWKRLDRFLPHFFAELFPEEAKKPKQAPITVPVDLENEKPGQDKEGGKEGGEEKAKETA